MTSIIKNNPDQVWAFEMIELLLQMKKAKDIAVYREKSNLKNDCLEYSSHKFDTILVKAFHQNPIKPKSGKRGRPKKGKICYLIDRFVDYKGEVRLFINDFSIPFTNKQAEQDIRMIKVKQKISGCFRTKNGTDHCNNNVLFRYR